MNQSNTLFLQKIISMSKQLWRFGPKLSLWLYQALQVPNSAHTLQFSPTISETSINNCIQQMHYYEYCGNGKTITSTCNVHSSINQCLWKSNDIFPDKLLWKTMFYCDFGGPTSYMKIPKPSKCAHIFVEKYKNRHLFLCKHIFLDEFYKILLTDQE